MIVLSNTSPPSWAQVADRFRVAAKTRDIGNIRLEIFDFNRKLLLSDEIGQADRSETLAILSASKWVTAAAFLTLVDRGQVALDDRIDRYLSHRDGRPLDPSGVGSVTLRQLLSFTGDITRDVHGADACFLSPDITLEECAHRILEESPKDIRSGSRFFYSDHSMSVLGHIVERLTGKSWQDHFDQTIARPLGFTSEARFYSRPRKLKGSQNPRPAAGLRLSVEDYEKFLAMLANFGTIEGKQVLGRHWIEEMERDQVLLSTGSTPGPVSYGLGNWYRREAESGQHLTHDSRGFNGFYPWIDRTYRYYAILGTCLPLQDGSASKLVESLATEIKPSIQACLRR